MSTQYQTIVYDQRSGAILNISQNLYISSRKHLARLANRPHWKDTGFIYFKHSLPIDPALHSIRSLSPNYPPALVTKSGVPIEYALIMQERSAVLTQGATCLVEFEGGMGDQLMEAAAVLTAVKQYPNSSFSIKCKDIYIKILQHVVGLPPVSHSYVGASKDAFSYVISNHTSYISDPRGGKFGKASLYGAWLGLDRVSKVAKIKVSAADMKAESGFFSGLELDSGKINIMCQFRSGSGHGKSWHTEKVVQLAGLFKSEIDCNFFVVGTDREVARGLPDIIDLTGRSTWWQTCLLESRMNLVVCIDSGVMHLARSLSVPYIALWGGTNAQMILGDDEQEWDIRLPLDCFDLVCYDCQRKTNACMVKITPEMVLHNARLLLNLSK